ncbi:MAG: DNA-3-methyladenine glycosylase family protein [Thermoplasmatota archaeon]
MTERLLAQLDDAIDHWRQTDPLLVALAEEHRPDPALSSGDDPFAALVESITHQQVSLAAGRTIHGRALEAMGGVASPAAALAAGPEALRGAGLSRSKVAYVLDLAERCDNGSLDLAALEAASDDEVIAALTAVKGIGVWTAKMFLLFHLQRPDVSAPEDLGVRVAAAIAYGMPEADGAALVKEKAAVWSPYNSLACLVLWHSRR